MRDAQVQILLPIPAFSGVYPTMRSKTLAPPVPKVKYSPSDNYRIFRAA
jgi:hypothetical protein